MQWKPNVTVAAIAQREDKFLIVEEDADDHIVFNQPAGHLEKGETLIEAVKREVLEETAWDFQPEAVIGLYLYPDPHMDITYLRVCFYGICTQHYPDRKLDNGILRAIWMNKEELESQKDKMRSTMVLGCIDDFLSGKRYPLDILNHYINKEIQTRLTG